MENGTIDELQLQMIPVMSGEGIPRVAPRHRHIELELMETRAFEDGAVHVGWRVKR